MSPLSRRSRGLTCEAIQATMELVLVLAGVRAVQEQVDDAG